MRDDHYDLMCKREVSKPHVQWTAKSGDWNQFVSGSASDCFTGVPVNVLPLVVAAPGNCIGKEVRILDQLADRLAGANDRLSEAVHRTIGVRQRLGGSWPEQPLDDRVSSSKPDGMLPYASWLLDVLDMQLRDLNDHLSAPERY